MITLTQRHKDLINQALGLDESPCQCQNFICADMDDPDLNYLMESNLMTQGLRLSGGLCYFFVTDQGKYLAENGFRQ